MAKRASAPPPPDTSRFSNAQMDLAGRMEEFGRQVWESSQAEWARLSDYAGQFMGMALPQAEEMFSWAREQRQRYESMVLPQIESLFKDAERMSSKAEEDRQRGAAVQDVHAAMQAEREANIRNLESYGVDPSMTRHQSLDRQAGVEEAAFSALAANNAAARTQAEARQLRNEAINVGTGFLQDANASAGLATNIGATGANVGTAATQAGAVAAGSALPFFSGAHSAINSAAGIVDTAYGRELDHAADQRSAEANLGGIGQLAGMGLSMIPGVGPMITPALAAMNGGSVSTTNNFGDDGAATGGEIEAPGDGNDDAGVLRVSDGEFVIPAEVVNKIGAQVLGKFVSKSTGKPPPSKKTALPVPG